jgi:hypothetical protein
LTDLFQKPSEELGLRDFKTNFQEVRQSILSGHWQNLGSLYRPSDRRYFGNTVRRIELPEEVDYINVSYQKLLPSAISLSFDVYLCDKTLKKLKEIQRGKHLPDAIIQSIYLKPLLISTSHKYGEATVQDLISDWIETLHISIEKIVFQYVKGFFYHFPNHSKSRLPCFDIYLLESSDEVKKNFLTLIEEKRRWLLSLDFQFFHNSYRNEDIIFYLNDRTEKKGNCNIHKVIVFEKNYSDINEEQGKDKVFKHLYHLQFYLNTITTPFAIIASQFAYLRSIERLREKVFTRMRKSSLFLPLNSKFHDFNEIQKNLRVIERMKLEFEQTKQWIKHDLIQDDGKELFELQKHPSAEEPRKFSDHLLEKIDFLNKTLYEHTAFIDKYFSRHTELLNIEVIYNLQVITVLFTIGAFVLAIITLLVNWKELLEISIILRKLLIVLLHIP